MKKNYFIVSTMFIAGALVMMSSSSGRSDDRTGAPSAGNCGNCHSGGSLGASINIGVTEKGGAITPVTSYKPGKTYTIAVAVLGTSAAKGFQSTVLDATNSKTGTTANPSSGSRIVNANSRDIVVQSSPSLVGAWTYEWTAPANATGDVTVYAAGVAANSNFSDNGDQAVTSKITLTLDASSGTARNTVTSLLAYPNPCNEVLQLNTAVDKITITGINGANYAIDFKGLNINTQALPLGFYYLKWTKGSENGIIKFQKI